MMKTPPICIIPDGKCLEFEYFSRKELGDNWLVAPITGKVAPITPIVAPISRKVAPIHQTKT
jgi:hypothetical protein